MFQQEYSYDCTYSKAEAQYKPIDVSHLFVTDFSPLVADSMYHP